MIDKRLFPLLETLAASGLDWLVVDILAMVGEENLQRESEAAMLAAQERILSDQDFRYEDEAKSSSIAQRQLSGAEQIELATDIVLNRIQQSLEMARSSIGVISTVIGEDDNALTQKSVERLALVNDDGELEDSIDIPAIDRALEAMTYLRSAVEKWRSEILGKEASE